MRRTRVTGRGRVLRAGLLLPLLAGVLAMHVLLLCSGSGEGHSAHGETVAVDPMAHAATVTAAVPGLEEAATVVRALPDPGAGGLGLAVCLAVVGAGLALGLRGRSRPVPPRPAAATTWSPGGSAVARPPPAVPLRVLLCVSRT